jgi:hypothetical protein
VRDDLNMKNSSTLSLARLYRAMLASVTSKSNNTVTFSDSAPNACPRDFVPENQSSWRTNT